MSLRTRGFVLAAVLAFLTIAAALVAGAWFAGLQELRTGRSVQAAERALRAAESGAAVVVGRWDAEAMAALTDADSAVVAVALPSMAGHVRAVVRPSGPWLMLLHVSGEDPTRTAVRDLAWVLRLHPPPLLLPGVLATVSPLGPGLAAAVVDADRPSAGTLCGSRQASPPVAAPWTDEWTDWDSLAAHAALGPSLPGPGAPIVLVRGDLRVADAIGEGILLVDGNADFTGGVVVSGVVLVTGRLQLSGPGNQIVGAARAGAFAADATALMGGSLVVRSTCAVTKALRRGAGVAPVRGWSRADMTEGW